MKIIRNSHSNFEKRAMCIHFADLKIFWLVRKVFNKFKLLAVFYSYSFFAFIKEWNTFSWIKQGYDNDTKIWQHFLVYKIDDFSIFKDFYFFPSILNLVSPFLELKLHYTGQRAKWAYWVSKLYVRIRKIQDTCRWFLNSLK